MYMRPCCLRFAHVELETISFLRRGGHDGKNEEGGVQATHAPLQLCSSAAGSVGCIMHAKPRARKAACRCPKLKFGVNFLGRYMLSLRMRLHGAPP